MKNSVIFIIVTLHLAGCEKARDYNNASVFMVEFSNHAWITQHSGIMIDSTGFVMQFNLPSTWNWPDDQGFITQEQMQENLDQTEIMCAVTKNDLAKYSSKLLKAENGKLSAPKNKMNDFGTVQYSGFVFDRDNKRYKRILIKQVGDWERDNSSKEAQAIYEWLQSPCK